MSFSQRTATVFLTLSTLASLSLAQTYPLRNYPDVGYFRCDEGTGATLTNSAFPPPAVTTVTLAAPGPATWVLPGQVGPSAIQVGSSAGGAGSGIFNTGVNPNYGAPHTVEFWLRIDGASVVLPLICPSAGAYQLVGPPTVATANTFSWQGGGTTATNEFVNVTFNPTIGIWQHFAMVQDTVGNQRRIYVNGAIAGMATFSPPPAGYPAATGLNFGGTGAISDFSFDEIRVWNRVRTAAEIFATFNAGIPLENGLTISQSGPMVGDLLITLTNPAATADNGWTLLTSDTTGIGNAGPLLGIRPDFFTFDILINTATYPQFPGNPFHFPVPGVGGFYPQAPFGAPPGSVLVLFGLSFDFVALLTTGGGFNSVSNVVRYTFI